jgi:signal transduction histidine kinase
MRGMVALEYSKLFSSLSAAELQTLQGVAKEISFPAGQQIFKEGDTGDGLYVVQDGLVQISALIGQGERRVLSRVGPGDFFGEMAVLDNEPRSASASAEIDTRVYFVPRDALLQMLERSPRLGASLVRVVSRRLREFNRQYVREVLQAERLTLVGRFARSIVHDLKNPLSIIGIAAELAGMENAKPESRAAAKQRIRKQVERISNLVNEILEFTHGSPTAVVLAMTDYGQFVQGLIEEIRPEIALKGVNIDFENPPPDVKIPLNTQRMTRVFYNLIHNATDAMPSGGQVKIRFKADANQVTTEIEDTGSGIAAEVVDHLFEAFATFGKEHGTGLGLSICKRIVQDHKGEISARNVPDGGALFAFRLPLPKS